jgi:hypothetical protein
MKKNENDAVLAALKVIAEADPEQLLRPEAVVAAAAEPSSPLNSHFTWDDSVAASQWRLEEARQLIRSVELAYDESWLKGPVPAYVSLTRDRGNKNGGGYRSTPQVLTNPQLRAELLATAKRELEGWVRRHRVLRGFVAQVALAGQIEGILSADELAAASASENAA